MTPTELHQRILLHELRTILLDGTREGGQIPDEWKAQLRAEPHETTPYLILGDWLDEAGSDLGELCRIQCELIGKLNPKLAFKISPYRQRHQRLSDHPFNLDWQHVLDTEPFLGVPQATIDLIKLTHRRWEIVEPLYPTPHKLGRTTRMLTDLLRYCCMKQGRSALVLHNSPADCESTWARICSEIIGGVWSNTRYAFGNRIQFDYRHRTPGGRQVTQHNADITFTDHACQERREQRGLLCIGGPWHGETREITPGARRVEYAELPPESVRFQYLADEPPANIAYRTRNYRVETVAFPRRRTRRPSDPYRFDDDFDRRDFLIHDDLDENQALERIQEIVMDPIN